MTDTAATASTRRKAFPIRGEGVSFVRDGRAIVDNVTIKIGALDTNAARRPLAILGPNGAGKSVLLRLLAGLLRPTHGTITWAGTPPDAGRALDIGFVFQRPVLLRRTARSNIAYVLNVAGFNASESLDRAATALERSGLAHLADRPARQLSGGEQQQLALARALAQEPGVLILDEPAANLDPASTAAIEQRLREAADEGMKIVLVSHDLAQVRRIAGEVAFMHRGRILERTPAVDFFNEPSSKEAQTFIRGELLL